MEEILVKYSSSRYEECLNLLKEEMQKEDSLVENCVKQNCHEVCQCLIFIAQNNSSKTVDTLRNLYKSYQNIIATGLPGVFMPLQLELTTFFNFIWWNLFYMNSGDGEINRKEVYLPVLQRGLKRGISCKINRSDNITEDILFDIKNAGKNIQIRDYHTMCLLTEVILLTLLYILKVNNSNIVLVLCLETVKTFIADMEKSVNGLKAVKEYLDPFPLYEKLFKFGFEKINDTVSSINNCSVDSLQIIKLLCFLLLKDYKNVLLFLKKYLNNAMKPLKCYFGALSALMLEDYDQCLGFVIMCEGLILDGGLKCRFKILRGQILSRKEDYKEALRCFIEARRISPRTAAAYYYMGEEYGKIGLGDEMVECFKDAIKMIQDYKHEKVSPFTTTFESIILSLIHPANEISEREVIYAAAVASGLTEVRNHQLPWQHTGIIDKVCSLTSFSRQKYKESVEMFEKYLEIISMENQVALTGERIIKTPGFVTILHEASTMNILTGNFSWAEHILSQAINHYKKLENTVVKPKKDVHITKDVNWLRNLLHEELGISDSTEEDKNNSIDLFSEEMVYFFEEDVIAMMLSAEVSCKSNENSYKTILGKLISIFSKYLAQTQKKESIPEEEKLRCTLVKALCGRTCLNIANYQIKGKISGIEIEKTFKRALSCNQGDKDALFGYCKFLLGTGKTNDAHKLWKTFREKKSAVIVDQCQSLALRYLLRTQVTSVEWEKIEMNFDSSAMDVVDLHL